MIIDEEIVFRFVGDWEVIQDAGLQGDQTFLDWFPTVGETLRVQKKLFIGIPSANDGLSTALFLFNTFKHTALVANQTYIRHGADGLSSSFSLALGSPVIAVETVTGHEYVIDKNQYNLMTHELWFVENNALKARGTWVCRRTGS
jgi:hypothetical protein